MLIFVVIDLRTSTGVHDEKIDSQEQEEFSNQKYIS
jgi:hypothetical protein